MSAIQTESLILSTSEKELSIKLKHKASKFTVLIIILAIIAGAFLFCMFEQAYSHAIIFGIAFVLGVFAMIHERIIEKKREIIFCFKINENGLRITEVNAEYNLLWSEVKSFGFVDRNSICGRGCNPPYQTCLYFSKDIHEERFLRKRFNVIFNNTYFHRNNQNMIIVSLIDEKITEEAQSIILKYIHMYCDPALEVSFITNTTEQAM